MKTMNGDSGNNNNIKNIIINTNSNNAVTGGITSGLISNNNGNSLLSGVTSGANINNLETLSIITKTTTAVATPLAAQTITSGILTNNKVLLQQQQQQTQQQLKSQQNDNLFLKLAPSTGITTGTQTSPTISSIATTTTTIAEQQPDLLQWKDMPQHLQFNPYVLTGYRPLQTFKGCMHSLFYMHNETINILTHGIPIVYILATVPGIMPWENEFRFLSWCHIIGAVAPWCGSFVYHLFMNLELGENMYHKLLQLDMLGIWISQSFGALPMVTATVYCLGWKLKWTFILAYSILSLWGLYKAMTALSPWQRRLCFLLPFTMRVLLTCLRASKLGGGSPASLTHVFLQDAVSVVGGAIGAMHIPEKWFPGSVDYYLNSHNIMHILVVLAVYSMHQATVLDIEWMSKTGCYINNTIIIDSHHTEL